ncbi:unnamed protein product [Microthlaspi erraticum]|uniref:GBF-interacting protein 1 N-terminal domain-containing protein n=1 Tax=Microthlaspi erraticum TaxID=1685480 RepID=A0A6D2K048_9BRAS|nr:unnamed protein product [Microthlaspi erraticum]
MGDSSDVSNANANILASSRKVVESLKEIVNCSELEIYVMFVECDMDPDETVNRLLFQEHGETREDGGVKAKSIK